LAIYRQRIEELTAIYQRGNPEPAELVEWLMRCVEEPATRAEGVLNLSESLSLLASQRERENEAKPQSVEAEESAGESDVEEEGSNEQSSEAEETDWERESLKLAAAVTQDHKTRLVNTLFGIAELSEADMELVSVVEELGDERLAPYLVSQLRRVADDAPEFAESLIRAIARVINDEDLERLADESRDAALVSLLEKIDHGNEPKQQDSARNPRAGGVTAAAMKRGARLKDFLKLVEYKTRR